MALDDAQIVWIFDNANTTDIATGALGAKKGSTQAVRDLGAQLERDHTAVRQQGRDLAKKLGVTPVMPAGDKSAEDLKATMATLNKLSGTAFDKAFLQHEVDYHNAVIGAINNTLMPAIKNADLKALVVKVAPAFVAHRDAAQNLLSKM